MIAPPYFDHVLRAYQGIHYHYKRGFGQNGPGSYYISREIERLAKMLRKLYFATGMHELASWSDQLKYMGPDVFDGAQCRSTGIVVDSRYSELGTRCR
jgi:hypothetical protein